MSLAQVSRPPAANARRTRAEMSRTTRAALVALARRHFGERGFADTSLEEITSAAELTRGALYYHFGSKNGLFVAVVDDVDAQIDRMFVSRMEAAGEGLDALEKIRIALSCYFEALHDPVVRQILIRDAPNYYPDFARRNTILHCRKVTAQAFETLRAQGRARFRDPDAMVYLLEGAVAGVVNWALDAYKSLDEIEAEIDEFLNSIGRP